MPRRWSCFASAIRTRRSSLSVFTATPSCTGRMNDAPGRSAMAPCYHAALATGLPKPLAVMNIGGVANVTWIGSGRDEILAFDTGPGNALIDDWVRRHTGRNA